MKACLICKKVVDSQFKFCPHCGAALGMPVEKKCEELFSAETFYKNAMMDGTVLKDYKGKENTVFIPDGVTELAGPFIVWAGSSVKEIIIPDSVKKIGRFTFAGFKTLERVVFITPNGWNYYDVLMEKKGVFRFNELAKPEVAAKYLIDLGNVIELTR